MSVPSIWQNDLIGAPVYDGMTLGAVLPIGAGLTFVKGDWPGLRGIRVGGVFYLATAFDASVTINTDGTVTI